jgi:hypothetical protein
MKMRQRDPGMRSLAITAVFTLMLLWTKAPSWAYVATGFGLGFSTSRLVRSLA